MEYDKQIVLKRYLEKANNALEDADFNLKNGRLNTTLNRIYYAVFYSIVALGYQEGFVTSKHKQLMGWFNKKFIHEQKSFTPKMADIYKEAYDNRMESDYDIQPLPSKEIIEENLSAARYFVKEISNYINKLQ